MLLSRRCEFTSTHTKCPILWMALWKSRANAQIVVLHNVKLCICLWTSQEWFCVNHAWLGMPCSVRLENATWLHDSAQIEPCRVRKHRPLVTCSCFVLHTDFPGGSRLFTLCDGVILYLDFYPAQGLLWGVGWFVFIRRHKVRHPTCRHGRTGGLFHLILPRPYDAVDTWGSAT